MQTVHDIFNKNKDEILKDFFTFLRFPSVSTDPQHKDDMIACANWLSDYLKNIGFQVEQWPTLIHPILFASDTRAGPDKPTLLIYNHYDVQPVDPLNEWTSPPFEPTIRDGEVYARGAQDNKGQCFYVLQALKAFIKNHHSFPINIKLCIEGEEESGSIGLTGILQDPEKREKLKADYLAIVDMGLRDIDHPALTLGVRGIVAMEVEATGSKTDLHSGSHGGIVYNPLHALAEVLAKLRDSSGRITVPGFYDDVVELSTTEKESIVLDFNADEYEKMFNAKATGGEIAYTPMERAWNRPTVEVNGISGGYTGFGFKTVIPAKATAKISCRLVPNQDPTKIGNLVAEFIKSQAPEGIHINVTVFPFHGKAIRANPTSAVVKAFAKAYEELYKKPCENIYSGGSIPIVSELAQATGSEVILLGFGLPDDQIHAPNEHFGVERLEKGFFVVYRSIEILGKELEINH